MTRLRRSPHAGVALGRLLLLLALLPLLAPQPTAAQGTTRLGIAGDRFTLNGTPTFLLGVSYFDAQNWHADDLDAFQRRGFTLIRIWLDWRDQGFFARDGTLSPQHQQTLLRLIDAASARGIVVEAAILDTDLSFDRHYATTAVRAVGTALKERSNVLYDLVNEHDHVGDTFSTRQLAELAQALRAVDPDAIFTVSSTERHLIDEGLRLRQTNISDDVQAPVSAPVLAPHLPRTADWFARTDDRVKALKTYLRSIRRNVPISLNEEARRGHSGLNPSAAQFFQAAREVQQAGAAAWLFHTDAGFDLRSKNLIAQLDAVERTVVDGLRTQLSGGTTTPQRAAGSKAQYQPYS